MNADLPTISRLRLPVRPPLSVTERPSSRDVLKLVEHPSAWSRWLDWLPKVRMLPPSDSPFTSPANTTLQQRVFLNGKAIEIPLK
jgi:hypothetical protein